MENSSAENYISEQKSAKKAEYFTTIHKLPLSRFDDVFIDEEIRSLVISGNPSEGELLEAWDNILTQYYEGLGSTDSLYMAYINARKELAFLNSRQSLIISLADILKDVYVERFAKKLAYLASDTGLKKFNVNDKEDYDKNIHRSYVSAKGMKLDIFRAEAKVQSFAERLSARSDGGSKMTRDQRQKTLINLSDYAGYPVKDDIMVSEYVIRINRYNAHVDQVKKK